VYNDITGLEYLVLEFRHNVVDKVRVGVGEERNGRDQRPTVVVDYLLYSQFYHLRVSVILVNENEQEAYSNPFACVKM